MRRTIGILLSESHTEAIVAPASSTRCGPRWEREGRRHSAVAGSVLHLLQLEAAHQREDLDTRFTVADILMAHVLSGIKDEGVIAPYPGVASYRGRCLARPAWKRTIEAYCARVEAG